MSETGVIKFNCTWIKADPLAEHLIGDINLWRDKVYKIGLIGMYKNGIGYGNISKRFQNDQFVISGTATGKFEKLSSEHYTLVTDYDIEKNWLEATGPVVASSESLTHAVIYECDKNCNAVIHIHHLGLWQKLINNVPTSKKSVEYGTPAMAKEVRRLFDETALAEKKILVMAGHEEGIIAFGKDPDEAGLILMNVLNEFN